MRKVQVTVTLVALLIAATHLGWPRLKIDAITLILLIAAAVPWLAPLVKSLEFPGGWKVEFWELERAGSKAEDAGLVAPPSEEHFSREYSFQLVAGEDPNLALAGLRIELERRLRELAAARGLRVSRGSIGTLLRELDRKDVLSPEQRGALAEMVQLLNNAVHGAEVNTRGAEWAIDYGPRLLGALEEMVNAG